MSIENSEIRQIIDKYANLVVDSELSGIDLSEEAKYVKDMLEEHPEYVEDFLSGKDRDGMNPRVHIFMSRLSRRRSDRTILSRSGKLT